MSKEIIQYKDLLKDGRWQKKRLEIFCRDNFCCLKCHTTNNIQVHHMYYDNGLKPWEYDNETMVTLCDKCHKEAQELLKAAGIIAFKSYMENIDLTDILK